MLDLSRLPAEVRRDTAAILREVWQTFPKIPPLLTDMEEEPDDQ